MIPTATPTLQLSNFNVTFSTPDGPVHAVRDVNLEIAKGECLGVVGESGSGKTQTFMAALGLAAQNASVSGKALFFGQDIAKADRKTLDTIRGKRVSMIFQDPLTALTPHMTVAAQMGEVLGQHMNLKGKPARARAAEWLTRVRIPEAARRLDQYPHELSGGMRQRVMIAMAMMTGPDLLIADEPTTALDCTVQAQVLDLLDDLQKETGTAIVLITHSMGVVARMAHRIAVMRYGQIVETAPAAQLFANPQADYTKMLIAAAPRMDTKVGDLAQPTPAEDAAPLLDVQDLKVHYPVRIADGGFGKTKMLRAVDGVSFKLWPGETLGVVGESGCGKSTLARAVLRFAPMKSGAVTFLGRTNAQEQAEIRAMRKDLQIIFQDPLASLDPRMTIGASIAEPLMTFRPDLSKAARETLVRETMREVGLDEALINRYPHELSGGQNQRVGIARAMILKPKLVVCDEAVSALDVSIQAQIMRLLASLQKELNVALVFISHDLAVVRDVSHRLMVLYLGRAVEYGPARAIYENPRHPYTKALLAAAPVPDPAEARARPRLALGDLPSPLDTRAAMRFLKSRVIDDPDAEQDLPKLQDVGGGHWVAEFDETAAA
jgi:oligopeptide/dipeptide ABC transporter ATP-binding protein